jgi:alkylation response protein AidB-like acyl-CoA dehydrogenase
MDLELTDEQKLLSDSIETLLSRAGNDWPRVWAEIVEFGGLMVGREALGAVELCLIGRNLGRHLASVPYLGSAAVRYAIAGIEGPPEAFETLPEEATSIAIAYLEPGGSWTPEGLRTTLSDGRLTGEKCTVEHAADSDAVLVLAVGGQGPALALVPTEAAGLEISDQDSIDAGAPLSHISMTDLEVGGDAVLEGEAAQTALARLTAIGGLLAAAEANGAASAILEQATEYAAQRRQFDRTIGSNQALRHILADMYTRETSSWSSVLYSAAALDDSAAEAETAASISKAYASRATRDVAHGAMQVFGGIAFTEEHDAHHFLRRINLRGTQFGDAEHHERALGRALAAAASR